MVHPDHETRVGAHRIFSVVLVPSSVCPYKGAQPESIKATDLQRTLSRTVSVFSSSAALFEKLKNQSSSSRENVNQAKKESMVEENNIGMLNRIRSTYSRAYSIKSSPAVDGDSMNKINKESVSFLDIFLCERSSTS